MMGPEVSAVRMPAAPTPSPQMIARLLDEVRAARERLRALAAALERELREKAARTAELTALRRELGALRGGGEGASALELADLEAERAALQADAAAQTETLRALEHEVHTLRARRDALQDAHDALAAERVETHEVLAEQAAELEAQREREVELRLQLADLRLHLEDTRARRSAGPDPDLVAEVRKRDALLEERAAELEGLRKERTALIEQLERRAAAGGAPGDDGADGTGAALRAQVERLERELERAAGRLEQARRLEGELREQREALGAREAALRDRLAALEAERDRQRTELDALRRELAQQAARADEGRALTARVHELERERERLSGLLDGATRLEAELRQQRAAQDLELSDLRGRLMAGEGITAAGEAAAAATRFRQERDHARAAAEAAEAERGRLAAQVVELEREQARLFGRLEGTERLEAELRQQRAALEQELARLRTTGEAAAAAPREGEVAPPREVAARLAEV